MVCQYLQVIKQTGQAFNSFKRMVMDCYMDNDFVGLRGNENPQDTIYAKSRTMFEVNFSNCPIM